MILTTAIHALLLGGLAAWTGASMVAVAGVLTWQIAESAVAPERPDTADASARALGIAVLAVVLGSLAFPGRMVLAGPALVALGVGLRVWAIRVLGRRFLDGVTLLPSHELERGGPYRWLAHPGALGTSAAALGIALTAGSWVGGAAWIGLSGMLLLRVRAEDRVLEAVRAR